MHAHRAYISTHAQFVKQDSEQHRNVQDQDQGSICAIVVSESAEYVKRK